MDQKALENFLYEKIPLAKAMGVHVIKAEYEVAELTCALKPNHNHLGTAFGGSLSTLMILAAYTWLFKLIDGNGHVLVKNCQIEYFTPVEEDLYAVCNAPSLEAREHFMRSYIKKGRARIELESEIRLKDGTVACRLRGEFIGRPDKTPS